VQLGGWPSRPFVVAAVAVFWAASWRPGIKVGRRVWGRPGRDTDTGALQLSSGQLWPTRLRARRVRGCVRVPSCAHGNVRLRSGPPRGSQCCPTRASRTLASVTLRRLLAYKETHLMVTFSQLSPCAILLLRAALFQNMLSIRLTSAVFFAIFLQKTVYHLLPVVF